MGNQRQYVLGFHIFSPTELLGPLNQNIEM
jgi:hypothetical protein